MTATGHASAAMARIRSARSFALSAFQTSRAATMTPTIAHRIVLPLGGGVRLSHVPKLAEEPPSPGSSSSSIPAPPDHPAGLPVSRPPHHPLTALRGDFAPFNVSVAFVQHASAMPVSNRS